MKQERKINVRNVLLGECWIYMSDLLPSEAPCNSLGEELFWWLLGNLLLGELWSLCTHPGAEKSPWTVAVKDGLFHHCFLWPRLLQAEMQKGMHVPAYI